MYYLMSWDESSPCGNGDSADKHVDASRLTPKLQATLTKPMGKRCRVDCYLNNVETSALWNTEAQVSIISSKWLGQTLPKEIVQHIGNL